MEPRKRGQTIRSDARNIVRQLIIKCDEEARTGQLRNNIKQANFRISDYSGVSISSISRLRKGDLESDGEEKLSSPGKKRPRKSVKDCSEDTKITIRNVIYSFYTEKKIVPSGPMLLAAIQEKIYFPWKLHSFYRLLRSMGFKWRKSNNIRKVLTEGPNIVAWRGKYLKAISYYRQQNRNIVYVGETWVDNTLCFGKCWQSKEMLGILKNSSHRYIIIHAGGKNGFINGAELMFKANSTTGDYHDQMNSENFEKWLQQKLIPNLLPNSVIIMDNAPYHTIQLNKVPTKYAPKENMIEWLLKNNITHSENMRKFELYDLISRNKIYNKTHKADEILKLNGHDVLRLPPCMCELNAIELAWAEMIWEIRTKNDVKPNETLTNDELETILIDAINSVTMEKWNNFCKHVEKIEKEYWEKDGLVEEILDTIEVESSECNSDTEEDTSDEDSD
ncbi:uncharacterized protein LOC143217712 [Lasioglossum baleicum]|uniref:uncharacterized protein LOC143217712 n=1 Tax=Lasioglossum baleicum TaxID=434251 RepID=UPI003FCCBFEE